MKMGKRLAAVLVLGFMMAVPSAFAASKLASACKADLKKLGCEAKTDKDAFECLEKNEKHEEKNDGFSAKCHKAHEAYEKKMGKEEKGEAEHGEAGDKH